MPTPPDAATRVDDDARIVLRDATDADGPALIALIGRCFADYPGCVLAVDAEMPALRAIATRYAAQGGRYWVAEAARRVIGSVGLKPSGDGAVAELTNLYVAPAARRRGLGRRLVERIEAEARSRGAAYIELWSDTRFADAHRLYAPTGFARRPGTRSLHDLSGSVEYGFVKRLGAATPP